MVLAIICKYSVSEDSYHRRKNKRKRKRLTTTEKEKRQWYFHFQFNITRYMLIILGSIIKHKKKLYILKYLMIKQITKNNTCSTIQMNRRNNRSYKELINTNQKNWKKIINRRRWIQLYDHQKLAWLLLRGNKISLFITTCSSNSHCSSSSILPIFPSAIL